MAKEFERSQRVASQLQRELADLIRSELKDPRLGWITVNDVEVSRDLGVARIYVSTLEAQQLEANLEALQNAAPFLRRELGKRLHVRTIPELRFYKDTSVERGQRLDELLGQIAKDSGEGGEGDV